MKLEFLGLVKSFPDGTRGLAGASLVLETPAFTVLSG
jgi:hypothetical protein